MFQRTCIAIAVRAHSAINTRLQRLRREPDAGMETADKILWAAVIVIIVGIVAAILRNKIRAFANSLNLTTGI